MAAAVRGLPRFEADLGCQLRACAAAGGHLPDRRAARLVRRVVDPPAVPRPFGVDLGGGSVCQSLDRSAAHRHEVDARLIANRRVERQRPAIGRPRAEAHGCILQLRHAPQRRSIHVGDPDLLASAPVRCKGDLAAIRRKPSRRIHARGIAEGRVGRDRVAGTRRQQIDEAKSDILLTVDEGEPVGASATRSATPTGKSTHAECPRTGTSGSRDADLHSHQPSAARHGSRDQDLAPVRRPCRPADHSAVPVADECRVRRQTGAQGRAPTAHRPVA